MNFLLTIGFRGENYHGFQVQENALSVCEVLQDAMQAVFGERPDVKGCSRTDAGVHAENYALSFKVETQVPSEKLPLALNAHLPPDVRVKSARRVPEDFHARYSACAKEYRYTLLNGEVDDPFFSGLYYRVPGPLSEAAMQAAGDVLLGRHDFSAFRAAGGKEGSAVRSVHSLQVRRRGDWVCLAVAGDGFLYHMVRIVAGTLLLAGQGKWPPGRVGEVLESRSRELAGPTLPAKGLCLVRVVYPDQSHF